MKLSKRFPRIKRRIRRAMPLQLRLSLKMMRMKKVRARKPIKNNNQLKPLVINLKFRLKTLNKRRLRKIKKNLKPKLIPKRQRRPKQLPLWLHWPRSRRRQRPQLKKPRLQPLPLLKSPLRRHQQLPLQLVKRRQMNLNPSSKPRRKGKSTLTRSETRDSKSSYKVEFK